jgi:hypothetical protein
VADISLAAMVNMGRPSYMRSGVMDSVRRRWDVDRDEFLGFGERRNKKPG